jgi:hypothetical protein
MSRIMRSPGLRRAGVVVLTALWLVPVEITVLLVSSRPVRGAARNDALPGPVGQEAPSPNSTQPPDDADDAPRPSRSKKSVRKKTRLPDKGASKKSGANAKKDADSSTKAAETGQLKFSQDIAPILVANCVGCHSGNGAGLRRGKLDLSTFDGLRKGTPKPDHPVIVPGKPDESHIVLRINGEETPKMPQGANAGISDEAIAKITRWVKEGAQLDAGIDPKAKLDSYAATPEQLRQRDIARQPVSERDKKVEAVGSERWKQANPKLKPEVVPGKQFIMFSNLPQDRATSALKQMETQYLHLRHLGLPAKEWAEKVSLYVFNEKKDFIEFARTVEGRDLEPEELTTFKLGIAQPYIATVDPAGGKKEESTSRRRSRSKRSEAGGIGGSERSLLGLLTEGLGSGAVAAAGTPPPWLKEGLGLYMASRVEPRSSFYHQLRQTAVANFQQGWDTKANQALGGDQITGGDRRAIGFALVECMYTSEIFSRGFPTFLHGMLKGPQNLDEMLKQVYHGPREQFLSITGEWVAARYGNFE